MAADSTPGKARGPVSSARWFEKTAGSVGRAPRLAYAMGSVAKAWTARFSSLSAAPGEIQFKQLSASKLEAVTAGDIQATSFATLWASEWKSGLGLRFERPFVTTVVEALFGGAGEEEFAIQGGALSPVESRIADLIGKQAGEALADGFSSLVPSAVLFERILPKPDLSPLGKPTSPVLIATFVLRTLGRAVDLDLLIPQPAVDLLNDKLAGLPDSAAPANDPVWSERLEAEVSRAMVRVRASIDMTPMSLGAIAGLSPGQILSLPRDSGSKVRLTCEDGELFRCDLGQTGGFYTVRLDEPVAADNPSRRKAH